MHHLGQSNDSWQLRASKQLLLQLLSQNDVAIETCSGLISLRSCDRVIGAFANGRLYNVLDTIRWRSESGKPRVDLQVLEFHGSRKPTKTIHDPSGTFQISLFDEVSVFAIRYAGPEHREHQNLFGQSSNERIMIVSGNDDRSPTDLRDKYESLDKSACLDRCDAKVPLKLQGLRVGRARTGRAAATPGCPRWPCSRPGSRYLDPCQ